MTRGKVHWSSCAYSHCSDDSGRVHHFRVSRAPTDVFLLAVPAQFSDGVRGIATGDPVPKTAGIGPAPRPDPRTVPPLRTDADTGLLEGRYSTPNRRRPAMRA